MSEKEDLGYVPYNRWSVEYSFLRGMHSLIKGVILVGAIYTISNDNFSKDQKVERLLPCSAVYLIVSYFDSKEADKRQAVAFGKLEKRLLSEIDQRREDDERRRSINNR